VADLRGQTLNNRYLIEDSKYLKGSDKTIVYKAKDQLTKRDVAIKILQPNHALMDTTTDVVRFKREIEALKRLNHPNIVAYVDEGQHDNCPYLVTEFKECNLREFLTKRGGMLNMSLVIDLFEDIASAVDAAHRLKIVHRDLKPENILLANCEGSVPEPYVADFGLATFMNNQTESGSQRTKGIGTYRYMAPEAWTGRYKYPERIDVYAMGVILYELLEGRAPFAGDEVELMYKHISEVPALPTSVKAGVGKVLLRALEKDPEKRYPSCGALMDALKAANEVDEDRATKRFDRRIALLGVTIALTGVLCGALAELSVVDNFIF